MPPPTMVALPPNSWFSAAPRLVSGAWFGSSFAGSGGVDEYTSYSMVPFTGPLLVSG